VAGEDEEKRSIALDSRYQSPSYSGVCTPSLEFISYKYGYKGISVVNVGRLSRPDLVTL
jgi:hypothetical protein